MDDSSDASGDRKLSGHLKSRFYGFESLKLICKNAKNTIFEKSLVLVSL